MGFEDPSTVYIGLNKVYVTVHRVKRIVDRFEFWALFERNYKDIKDMPGLGFLMQQV